MPSDRRSSELERSGALELASLELEQELAAIEHETRRLVESPAPAEPHVRVGDEPGALRPAPAPLEHETRRLVQSPEPAEPHVRVGDEPGALRPAPAPPRIDDRDVGQRRPMPRRVLPETWVPHRFHTAPLFPATELQPEGGWRTLTAAASATVFAVAILGGGYFYYRLGATPAPLASLTSTPEPRAEASTEPSTPRDASAAPGPVPAPAVAAAATRIDPSAAPPAGAEVPKAPEAVSVTRASGGANIITQIGVGASVTESGCPAAVAALALCEWVAKANR